MRCKKCGCELDENAVFCHKCGEFVMRRIYKGEPVIEAGKRVRKYSMTREGVIAIITVLISLAGIFGVSFGYKFIANQSPVLSGMHIYREWGFYHSPGFYDNNGSDKYYH